MTNVTNASAFKSNGSIKVIALSLITFGLYGLYWVYDVAGQLEQGTDADISATMTLIGLFIPFVNLYFLWKFANAAEAVTDQSGAILFVLWLVIFPAAVYLIQEGINSHA